MYKEFYIINKYYVSNTSNLIGIQLLLCKKSKQKELNERLN